MNGLLLWVFLMGVLVAVPEGHVGEEITALLHLVGLWGEEVLSYSADAYSQRGERERAHRILDRGPNPILQQAERLC